MDWPVGVKAEALFSSDRALSIIDQDAPAWAFLDPNNPTGLRHRLNESLATLGSNHPSDV